MPLKSALKKPAAEAAATKTSLPDQITEWASTSLINPLQGMVQSLGFFQTFAHKADDFESETKLQTGAIKLDTEVKLEDDHEWNTKRIITLTSSVEGSKLPPRNVKVMPTDSFEQVLDLIKNEFGKLYWPILTDPQTGNRLVVIDDFSFEELCKRASKSGGRLRVVLHSKIVMDEHEVYIH